jgi:hypothetical protein
MKVAIEQVKHVIYQIQVDECPSVKLGQPERSAFSIRRHNAIAILSSQEKLDLKKRTFSFPRSRYAWSAILKNTN